MTDNDQHMNDLMRLKYALRAMSKSLNKALMVGSYDGTGDMMIKSYQRLHAKTMELFPNDFFIETLAVDFNHEADDKQKLSQVQLSTEQLANYVDSLLKDYRPSSSSGGSSFYGNIPDMEDIQHFGANIRDQIVRVTRNTLRTALANIDIDLEHDHNKEEENPQPRRKVRINVDEAGEVYSEDTPDEPAN